MAGEDRRQKALKFEIDGVIVRSLARILSNIADIFEEFKNMVIRRLRRY